MSRGDDGLHNGARCYDLPVIDWNSCPAVERDPARVSGAWVFTGTRVPISALFENLEDDASVLDFIEWFPGVSVGQARAVLEHAARSSLAAARVNVLFDQGTPAPLSREEPQPNHSARDQKPTSFWCRTAKTMTASGSRR